MPFLEIPATVSVVLKMKTTEFDRSSMQAIAQPPRSEKIFDCLQLQFCKIQGRLFELSLTTDIGSESFIKCYMKSKCAADFGRPYHRFQWAGQEYLLEEIQDECKGKLAIGEQYTKDVLFWIGYAYSYWHILTGESAKKILAQAPPKLMKRAYAGLHTIDMQLAIEDLKQLAAAKKAK